MPIRIALTTEVAAGTCKRCFMDAVVYSFFIETKEGCSTTEPVCVNCMEAAKIVTDLEDDPTPPTGACPPSKRRRRAVAKQERRVAELVGGRTQKASGARLDAKGDVRVKDVLRGECKSTVHKSFVVKRDVLDKIRSECTGREKPFVQISFLNRTTLATEDEWVLIPLEQWEGNKCLY